MVQAKVLGNAEMLVARSS